MDPRPASRTLVAATLLLAACGKEPPEDPMVMTGHVLSDVASGIAVDLPSNWAGRYRLSDVPAVADPGIERELTLRFVKADSTVEPAPLLVLRVVSARAWNALPPDSASARYGTVIARDSSRTLAARSAPGNPLATGTADALGYDSLMIIVVQRPLRVLMRPPALERKKDPVAVVSSPRGPVA